MLCVRYSSCLHGTHIPVCVYVHVFTCVCKCRPVANKAMIIDGTFPERQALGLRILFSLNPHNHIQQRLMEQLLQYVRGIILNTKLSISR